MNAVVGQLRKLWFFLTYILTKDWERQSSHDLLVLWRKQNKSASVYAQWGIDAYHVGDYTGGAKFFETSKQHYKLADRTQILYYKKLKKEKRKNR